MRPPVSFSRRWTGVFPSTASGPGANSKFVFELPSIPARPRAVYFTDVILTRRLELARGTRWTTIEDVRPPRRSSRVRVRAKKKGPEPLRPPGLTSMTRSILSAPSGIRVAHGPGAVTFGPFESPEAPQKRPTLVT
jgi:hypothetical protein